MKKDELIQELMELVFDKAEKDSGKSNANALCRYLSQKFESYPNFNITERNLDRYYKGYIAKTEDKIVPQDYTLDGLSTYLKFKNFVDFESNIGHEKEKKLLREDKKLLENKINTSKKIALVSASLLGLFLITFFLKVYEKNCMIWVDDHYEKAKCSGTDNEKSLDESVFKNFRKVNVCKDSVFFENDKPRIHYVRHDSKIEFFTSAGEHPIYQGIFTKPITTTIIASRVKDCDSIE